MMILISLKSPITLVAHINSTRHFQLTHPLLAPLLSYSTTSTHPLLPLHQQVRLRCTQGSARAFQPRTLVRI